MAWSGLALSCDLVGPRDANGTAYILGSDCFPVMGVPVVAAVFSGIGCFLAGSVVSFSGNVCFLAVSVAIAVFSGISCFPAVFLVVSFLKELAVSSCICYCLVNFLKGESQASSGGGIASIVCISSVLYNLL